MSEEKKRSSFKDFTARVKKFVSSKKFLTGSVIVLSITLVGLLLFFLDPFGWRVEQKDKDEISSSGQIAQVYIDKGDVTLLRNEKETIKKEDFSMQKGDTILAGENSIVDLEFDFGRVALDSESRLSTKNKDKELVLYLWEGIAFVSTKRDGSYSSIVKLLNTEVRFSNGSGMISAIESGTASKQGLVRSAYALDPISSDMNFKVLSISGEVYVEKDGTEVLLENGKEMELNSEGFGDVKESDKKLLDTDFYKEISNKEHMDGKDLGIGKDMTAPNLSIISPEDGEEFNSKKIEVKFKSNEDGWYWDGDKWQDMKDGKEHSFEYDLDEGENEIEVKIKDLSYNKTIKKLTVSYVDAEESDDVPIGRTTPQELSISLSGSKVDNGVKLNWSVSGGSVDNGFKIVKSTSPNPVYPGNTYKYLTSNSVRSYTWELTDGKTYHFRVCQYNGNGKCLKYSNDITVTAPKVEEETPDPVSISLSAEAVSTGVNLSWSVSGDNSSSDGFKIVKSSDPNPVYPGNDYEYKNDNSLRSYTWGLDAGTYNFRVCQYVSGECISYSNNVEVTVSAE